MLLRTALALSLSILAFAEEHAPIEARSTLSDAARASQNPPQKSNEAYVTLLYNDEFLLGARVLGQSIKNTGSNR